MVDFDFVVSDAADNVNTGMILVDVLDRHRPGTFHEQYHLTPTEARRLIGVLYDYDPTLASAIVVDVQKDIAATIRRVAADPERLRPKVKDAKYATDLADDSEWAAMLAEGSVDG